jgi:Fe(3+) dicitrate transport protein
VIPGVRVERIFQELDETLNSTGGTGLKSRTKTDWVPLLGLGLEQGFENTTAVIFSNVSQGYRPVQFQEGVPLTNSMSVNQDLDPAKTLTAEIGVKEKDAERALQFETSVFWISYNNRIGSTATQFINTGAARHVGADGFVSYRFESGLLPGSFRLSQSIQYLNARFTEGSLLDKTPQYAPTWTLKSKVQHVWSDAFNYGLTLTALSNHFADDTNTALQAIPGYAVYDFDLSWKPFSSQKVSILGAVQNLFDRHYWSRVRSTGIDPAPPLTFQLGASIEI